MKILVTGSTGQLAGKIRELSGTTNELKFIFASKDKLDITNTSELHRFFSGEKIDILINCAAYTNVDGAESTYQQANKVNNFAVKEISRLSETYNFIFVHISTDYVFDGSKGRPYKEKDKTNPLGAYGKSKLHGEVSIMENNCRSIIIRTSWLYSNLGSNFVKKIINLAQEKESLEVVDDQLGSPTSAKDLSKAIMHMIRSKMFIEASSKKEIFHFCNSGVCSWYELAKEIVKIKNLDCKIIPCKSTEIKAAAKRPFYSALNSEKFSNSFSFDIKPWQEALKLSLQDADLN